MNLELQLDLLIFDELHTAVQEGTINFDGISEIDVNTLSSKAKQSASQKDLDKI